MSAIAIVGLACRYPGATDAGRYWDLLRSGREGITHFTSEGLVAAGADPDLVRQKGFVPAKGVLPGAANFDWSFFGYSRAEAAGTDPQHRVFLECASAAIDDAGLDPTRFPGRIGVYGGAERFNPRGGADASPLARVIGAEKDFLTSRVAYKLGLRGPAVTVQTACSTSLTAVHLAARALLGGECDAALAGGVAVFPPGECGYLYQEGGILSPDGHCRPFDQHAGGTVPGEGVGVVVLKRLSDALAHGDRIAAVLAGSAVNNDGSDKLGYTAPAVPGQSEVIRFAHQVAGIDPADLDHVEAHGTATRIGDPVEVAALNEAFGERGECWLGAVKSNLGHTGAAAGVAGLIKTVLMLEHGELVPTLHFGQPNPLLDLDSTPFRVVTDVRPWPDRGVRLAAVSAFGVGGTNAHVVLQEPPRRPSPLTRRGPRLLTLSAAKPEALAGMRTDLAGHLRGNNPELPAVARTLAARRMFRHRTAVVAENVTAAAEQLDGTREPVSDVPAKVAFLFPGQGVLRHAAGRAAYRLLPQFRSCFDGIRAELAEAGGPDLGPVVGEGDVAEEWFADTVHQQLGLFSLGVSLGVQLRAWDLRPAAMFGNSVGEYAAATLAGAWDPGTAALIVFARARAMWDTEPGRMASVTADPADVAERLRDVKDVTIAVAGSGTAVLSGPESDVDALLAGDVLAGLDVRVLANRRAFHSALMEPAVLGLRPVLEAVPAGKPRVRLVSNETGGWADPAAVTDPGYWLGQLRNSVRLADGAATLLGSGCDAVVELGPGSSMTATLRRHPAWRPGIAAVPLLGRADDDPERALLSALGALWERGVDAAVSVLDDDSAVRVSLPGHPYAAENPERARPATPARTAPAVVASAGSPRAEVARLWCRTLGVASASEHDDFFALGGESLLALDLCGAVSRIGHSVSVADFTRDATFGGLLRLAALSEESKVDFMVRPLFLAADATGTALPYRALAAALGEERPVHGLDAPAGVSGIERIAAAHVAELRRVQPEGPYTLGGWSFGAVVAHEMAVQLGSEADTLVCLDGRPPDRPGLPVGADPGYLAGTLRLQVEVALGLGPAGRRLRTAPALRRRLVTNLGALLRYRPRPVACPVLLVPVGGHEPPARLYPKGVTIVPAPGDHWSMLAPPHVATLAELLRDALPAVRTAPTEMAHHVS